MTHYLAKRLNVKFSVAGLTLVLLASAMASAADVGAITEHERHNVTVTRLLNSPIIGPETDPSIGNNIQGPSMIRVPDWIKDPLGKYYLYFADHKGQYIRLAYADSVMGPWKII